MSSARVPERVAAAAVALVPLTCVTTLAPATGARAARLAGTAPTSSFASTLTDLCALAATAVSLWLVLTGAVVVATRTRDTTWSRRLHRVAPPAWRRAVLAAVGASVASASLHACAAPPAPADPAPGPGLVSTHPSTRGDLAGLRLPDRPGGHRRPAAAPPRQRAATVTVTVAEGDCLWAIAARALAATGHADAGPRQIAAATRAWYVANHDAIGADPDLIRPGTTLTPPLPPDEGRLR